MTLQEYEAQGGCEGCYFYGTIDVDGRKGCTFHWFDDESEDWEYSKNFISTLILALTNRITSVKSISQRKTMVFQRTGGVSRVLQSSVW